MSNLEVSKFDKNGDFRLWQVKIQSVLVDKGLDIALEEVDPDLATISREEVKKIDKKALAVLRLALADNVPRQVCEEKTAVALWKKLESLYLDRSLSSRFYLMMRLFRIRMQEGTPIRQYIDEFNKAVLDYQNVGSSMDNDHLAILFLCSLPDSYDVIRDQILYGSDSISMDDITSILLSKDLLKKTRLENHGEGEGPFVNRGRSIDRGHGSGDSSSNGRRKSKGRSKSCSCSNNDIICNCCKGAGHIKWNCPKLKKNKDKENNGSKGENSSSASVAVADDDSSECGDLLVVTADCLSVGHCVSSVSADCDMSFSTGWILDSACSYHMCPHRQWFATYEPLNGGSVSMGNNTKCRVVGIGTIRFKLFDGIIRTLTNVCHVVGLTKNLISFKVLDWKGYKFVTHRYQMKVFRGSLCVMKALTTPDTDDLYFLQGSLLTGSAAVASSSQVDDDTMTTLWHMRLGHMSKRGMVELSRRGLLGSRKTGSLQFCEHCVFGKQTRLRFSKSVHATRGILDYVHTDLWGEAPVTSIGGGKYLLTFVDYFSRNVWVYILKSKDETFARFRQWKAMVETQTERKVKYLRSGNGTEFRSREFDDYCLDAGITRHYTTVGTPQQNGVAKRMNTTLLERTHCMLSHAGLPQSLWAEIVTTTCYLVNRSP